MEISFFPTVCFRSPVYPTGRYHFAETLPDELIHDELFIDSIYVASPEFYKTFEKWKQGKITDEKKRKKILLTLVKYYNRMCFRATPFGLFSSYGTIQWGSTTNLPFHVNQVSCKIKLDTSLLCVLIEKLEKLFVRELSYQVNTSLYRVNDEYRYYEYEIEQNKKKYKLSALEITDELEYTINGCSNTLIPFSILTDKLSDSFQLSKPVVADYLVQLINSQVLVSELQPRLSDDDPLQRIIAILKVIKNAHNIHQIDHQLTLLLDLNNRLHAAHDGPGLRFKLQDIQQIITASGIEIADSRGIFQLDSYNQLAKGTLNTGLQAILAEGLHALHVLTSENIGNYWYDTIKEEIRKRFGEKPVLLSHLFDPDTGIIDADVITSIDFGNNLLNQLNIFKSVQTSPGTKKEKTSPVKELLGPKLNDLLNTDSYIIKITKQEITKLEQLTGIAPLPPTFPVMFKLINNGDAKLLIEDAGGTSGTSLLGRFGNENQETASLLRDIADFEKDSYTESIIASVVHLPENRVGNVLQNPDLRDFQIPYLSSSSLPPENQVPVSDMWIQLNQGSLILFSKKLNKRIIPRIDNAHNYSSGSLSVYRLLGALQSEHTVKYWSLKQSVELDGIKLLPRIAYKDIILQSASWILKSEDIINEKDDKSILTLMDAFNVKCTKWRIPELFLWAEADQTILVNRFDPHTFGIFITGIRKKKRIVIKEYLPPDPNGVVDQNNHAYNHQFIAIAKNTAVYHTQKANLSAFQATSTLQRNFAPGTEWLYYKIYCSTYFADTLLNTVILPLNKHWQEKGYTAYWFFIRYSDPDHHIRLRFHLLDETRIELLINDLKQSLATYTEQGLIWKTQIDTYERELERYTPQVYPLIERYFNIDSEYCIQTMMHKEQYEADQFPLFWVSLKNIDDVFNLFSFTADQKHTIASRSVKAFQEEFSLGDDEKDIIYTYYHQNHKQIKLLIGNMAELRATATFSVNWQQNQQLQSQLFNSIKAGLSDNVHTNLQIATSLVHMHYNRLYPTEQRRFEMIGYMLISKYYGSVLKR